VKCVLRSHDRLKCAEVRALFAENNVRFRGAEQVWFTHVLLARIIQPIMTEHGGDIMSGFAADRSTVDDVLALRLLSEFDHPLLAYHDMNYATFDSVD